MKKFIVSIIACGLLVGCAANKDFIAAVDSYTKVILPEYKTYIAKDSTLSASTKTIRTNSANQVQAMIDKEKAAAK